MWIILCNVVLKCGYQLIAFAICVILYVYHIEWNCFVSIEIWETWDWRKTCVLRNVFFGIHNKYLMIIFMRNEIIIIKNWPNCERKKKWCRLMVKAFLLLSGKNGAIWTWHSYCMMKIQWYHNLIKYYLPCQSIPVIIYCCVKKKLWMINICIIQLWYNDVKFYKILSVLCL